MLSDKVATSQGFTQGLALDKVFKNNNNSNAVSEKTNKSDNSNPIQSEKDSSTIQKAFSQAKAGMLKDLFGVQEESQVKTSASTQETSKAQVGAASKEKAPEEVDQSKKQEQTGLSKSIGTEDKGSQKVVSETREEEKQKPVAEAIQKDNSLLQQQTQTKPAEGSAQVG